MKNSRLAGRRWTEQTCLLKRRQMFLWLQDREGASTHIQTALLHMPNTCPAVTSGAPQRPEMWDRIKDKRSDEWVSGEGHSTETENRSPVCAENRASRRLMMRICRKPVFISSITQEQFLLLVHISNSLYEQFGECWKKQSLRAAFKEERRHLSRGRGGWRGGGAQ